MLDLQPTNILAADQLARYVRTIAPGDTPYLFGLIDDSGRQFNIGEDHITGGYLVLVFVSSLTSDAVQSEIKAFEQHAAAYEAANAKIVIVTAQSSTRINRDAKRAFGISFPVLVDASGFVFAAYGIQKRGTELTTTQMRSVVITPLRQIRCYWDIEMTKDHAAKAASLIDQAKLAEEVSWTAPHPPVLVVPQVFSPEECAGLIREFDTNGQLQIDRPNLSVSPGAFKMPVYEYNRQDRVDHIITDPQQQASLDKRLQERVLLLVRRVFAFTVTRRENISIARYVGARSGVEIGHRDNTDTAVHRRFALSLSLNEDYEGGELVFREYSNRGYRLPTGSAIVFSSSLLHEVEEITKGVRYNLLSHFFDDAAAAEAKKK